MWEILQGIMLNLLFPIQTYQNAAKYIVLGVQG